jgi:hypothetical protein
MMYAMHHFICIQSTSTKWDENYNWCICRNIKLQAKEKLNCLIISINPFTVQQYKTVFSSIQCSSLQRFTPYPNPFSARSMGWPNLKSSARTKKLQQVPASYTFENYVQFTFFTDDIQYNRNAFTKTPKKIQTSVSFIAI